MLWLFPLQPVLLAITIARVGVGSGLAADLRSAFADKKLFVVPYLFNLLIIFKIQTLFQVQVAVADGLLGPPISYT